METRKVAIACQGGGIHGAFTCGVLDRLLHSKEIEQDSTPGGAPADASANARRRFEIVGLSGTSAGALNAFMVWYGLLNHRGQPDAFAAARQALNHLWDTFQVNKLGEAGINALTQYFYTLSESGVSVKQTHPAEYSDWLMATLNSWSRFENLLAPKLDLGEVRPEFYDFMALLKTCAPDFVDLQPRLDEVARQRIPPRLLLGAVEILSGRFEAFDSWSCPDTPPEQRRPISYQAVAASGTLPDLRRAQRVPGLKNDDGQEALYWDGVFSQNPPIREFAASTCCEETPDEIWVIRINPQKRTSEPTKLAAIEDRRNELSGNLSLFQELRFIETVNQWLARIEQFTDADAPLRAAFANYKPITVYMLTMAPDHAELGLASKFDRSPAFVQRLREHGAARAEQFLPLWQAASPELLTWPTGDALARLDGG
ncbi:MAG TPA: patatin-like phospholipase family protein [Accumulibacter sp.]|nr:patatin-like phospholipase family protein [Accumulibacter sp.]HMW17689.1 patatin-like phospholipase family protein [Accumulibacter sp.]HMX23046.1 patatin-like phospholipase family protein [Accumulibacter sp.]HNC18862.1 patatin-like phospholipase family protein [Accumulibacter sp.]HND80433.1 patatin-like phospholipase family protein [Accumulibacter sp.]